MMDPNVARILNQQSAVIRHLQDKLGAIESGYQSGMIGSRSEASEALEKVSQAIAYNAEAFKNMQKLIANQGGVYAEQVPGKREPFYLSHEVTIPSGSVAVQTGSEPTSASGPFEIAQIMAVSRSSVVVGASGGVLTREVRFRSINSAVSEPMVGPDAQQTAPNNMNPGPTNQGVLDFLWTYQTGNSNRIRMNRAIPSSFLFSEHGRPAYLACGDMLPPHDSIQWTVTPIVATRAWFGTVNPGGVADAAQAVIISLVLHGCLMAQAPDYTP